MLQIAYRNTVKTSVLFSIFHRKARGFSHELKHLYFIADAARPSAFPPSPIQRFAAGGETGPPGRGDVRHDMAWHCRRLAAETRGDRAPMVPLPLLTPQTLLWTRLPPVARLNARGPQGRLVLQGSTLDGSGAFRSDGASALHRLAAHCYARRFTQSNFRA